MNGKYKARDLIHHETMTEALPIPPYLIRVVEERPGGYVVEQLDKPGHKFVSEAYLDVCVSTG